MFENIQVESDLPKFNKELFLKLQAEKLDVISQKKKKKKRKEGKEDLLGDERFKGLFTDENFEV